MRLIPNTFTEYEMTEEEVKNGFIFTDTNKAAIQNLLAQAAKEKVALKYDPSKPHEFLQREAELQGEIGVLSYLLVAYENSII